jgi:hypothetical protein
MYVGRTGGAVRTNRGSVKRIVLTAQYACSVRVDGRCVGDQQKFSKIFDRREAIQIGKLVSQI